MSAMRHTNNQINCKSSVKSEPVQHSVQHSIQRQVIRQINVKSTSENHPHPQIRKNGERLTPIASDSPAEPGLRRWRGGENQQDNGAPNAATGKIPNATDSASV